MPISTPAPSGTPTEVVVETATETAVATIQAAPGGLQLLPGFVFFLGGLVALLVVLSVSHYR